MGWGNQAWGTSAWGSPNGFLNIGTLLVIPRLIVSAITGKPQAEISNANTSTILSTKSMNALLSNKAPAISSALSIRAGFAVFARTVMNTGSITQTFQALLKTIKNEPVK